MHDDLNRYIFSFAFLPFKRKTADCHAVPDSSDYAHRLDTCRHLGRNIAAEFKSGQAKFKTDSGNEIEIKISSLTNGTLETFTVFGAFFLGEC